MSISPVSFGATTKMGNDYKKSNAGKVVGATTLVGASAMRATQSLKNLGTNWSELLKTAEGKTMTWQSLALFAGVGLGLGALVDVGTNIVKRHNANKADKAERA